MDKVNKELKVSRAAVAKGELEAKDLERLCKIQENQNQCLQASIESIKSEIPRMWKRLDKEKQDFKNHKKDVKSGKRKPYAIN
jgi:hypothetical protein